MSLQCKWIFETLIFLCSLCLHWLLSPHFSWWVPLTHHPATCHSPYVPFQVYVAPMGLCRTLYRVHYSLTVLTEGCTILMLRVLASGWGLPLSCPTQPEALDLCDVTFWPNRVLGGICVSRSQVCSCGCQYKSYTYAPLPTIILFGPETESTSVFVNRSTQTSWTLNWEEWQNAEFIHLVTWWSAIFLYAPGLHILFDKSLLCTFIMQDSIWGTIDYLCKEDGLMGLRILHYIGKERH